MTMPPSNRAQAMNGSQPDDPRSQRWPDGSALLVTDKTITLVERLAPYSATRCMPTSLAVNSAVDSPA